MKLLYVYKGLEYHCKAWDVVHLENILRRTYENVQSMEALGSEAIRVMADSQEFRGYRNFLGYRLE